MQVFDASTKENFSHNQNAFFLTLYWMAGLVIGAHISICQDSISTSLMQSVLRVPVSFVGLTTSVLIPFLFTVLAVYIRQTAWFKIICFYKAAAFGYCAASLIQLFQFSAWVPCFLLLVPDCLYQVFLFWFFLRNQNEKLGGFRFDCFVCVGIGVLIILLNYCFMIPGLQGIF